MGKLIDTLKDCQLGSAERRAIAAKIAKHLSRHPMAACTLTAGEIAMLRADGIQV